MKRIVMLYGQNHKGSTYNIARMIADKIEGEKEVTEFFFPRDLNHFCQGCYSCLEDMKLCPFYGEKEKIINAIDEAEILIVATPTYCMHMSAPLKSFFDLTFDLWMSHKPMESMFAKKAVIVSTAAGAGAKSAVKDVKDCLFYMGVPYIIKYGITVQAMSFADVSEKKKQKIDKDTSAIAKKLNNNLKPYVKISTKFMFLMMRLSILSGLNSSASETAYWREKGWLDKNRPWK